MTLELQKREEGYVKSQQDANFSEKYQPKLVIKAGEAAKVSAALYQKKFDGETCVLCQSPLVDLDIGDGVVSKYCNNCKTSHPA